MATKNSKPLTRSVRTMRIVLAFLGFGVAVAALFAIVLTVKSNLDVRSKAAEVKKVVRTTCFPWGKQPFDCNVGYKCVKDERSNTQPNKGQWGRCVLKPTPTPTPVPVVKCNNTISPPVLCPKGSSCVTAPRAPKGSWGTCQPVINYGGCNLAVNPPRVCEAGYYCQTNKCITEKCIGGDGICVKLGTTTTPTPTPLLKVTPTPSQGCYYVTQAIQCIQVVGGPPCPTGKSTLVCPTPFLTPTQTPPPGCYYESVACTQQVGGPPCPSKMLICQSKTPEQPVYIP